MSSVIWRIHHKAETASTNTDALTGAHGDVFTADFQSAGRGRLDHKWQSRRGENVMMSAVLDVAGLAIEQAATLPLVAGLAVASALKDVCREAETALSDSAWRDTRRFCRDKECASAIGGGAFAIKWPNDVYFEGRKIAGILCERRGDNVIVGIGINVNQREFASEIAARAASLALVIEGGTRSRASASQISDAKVRIPPISVKLVIDTVLTRLGEWYCRWREEGFSAAHAAIAEIDFLKGREIGVIQTDDDRAPLRGVCGGIADDGALLVGGERVYAGEAHVQTYSGSGFGHSPVA